MPRVSPHRRIPLLVYAPLAAFGLGPLFARFFGPVSEVFVGAGVGPRGPTRAEGVVTRGLPPMAHRMASRPPPRQDRAGPRGPFSPAVDVAKVLMGQQELSRLRGEIIKAHTQTISAFVDTSDSWFGRVALQVLFTAADEDGSGALDKEEVEIAARKLGFAWLRDGKVDDLIRKVDTDENAVIDFEEFAQAAPKTLRQNLVKLAKQNGKALGFMA